MGWRNKSMILSLFEKMIFTLSVLILLASCDSHTLKIKDQFITIGTVGITGIYYPAGANCRTLTEAVFSTGLDVVWSRGLCPNPIIYVGKNENSSLYFKKVNKYLTSMDMTLLVSFRFVKPVIKIE